MFIFLGERRAVEYTGSAAARRQIVPVRAFEIAKEVQIATSGHELRGSLIAAYTLAVFRKVYLHFLNYTFSLFVFVLSGKEFGVDC